MAVVTWDGSSSTAYSTAANWDTGSVPGDGDDVVIPDTSSINACNVDSNDACNSVTVLTNGEIGSDAGAKLAILGEADGTGATTDGFGVKIDGAITDNGGTSIDFDIRTQAATNIDLQATSGKVRNVIINHASCVATLGALLDITGDLTITAGQLNTNSGSNYALTVTGDCYVAGTLTGNASAISLGSLEVAASGKYNATSGTTTITGEDSSTGFAWDVNGTDSFDNNDGIVLFDLGSGVDSHVRTGQSDGANSFHHLTVLLNASTNTLTMRPNAGTVMTVEGDLTVQEGILQKNTHSNTLTVTGDVSIESGGKIDATSASGANNFGSLTIASGGTYLATSGTTTVTGENSSTGFAMHNAGTFTHNNGTVTFNDNASHIAVNTFYNLIIETGSSTGYIQARVVSGSTITVANDFTIKEGRWNFDGASNTFTVTGNTLIESGGVYGYGTGNTADPDRATGAHNHGSLEIQSGGTYNATSGTTTITTGGTIGGTTNTAFGGEGTFTHNNGTLVLDSVLHRIPKGGTFYNLKLTGSQNTGGIYLYSDTLLPQGIMPDGTTGSAYFSVLGTLEITEDEFRPYNADKVYIHNLVIGDGTGSANSAKFDFAEVDEFDGKVFVDNVTIHSDGQLLFGDGDETSATEGSSALNIYGAFRNLGGNVTIE